MFLLDNIDFAESEKYILSIRLLPDGFYFSIHCPVDKAVFYQNSVSFRLNSNYLENIEKLIFDYSFFSYNYNRINVICVDDETTIVPNEFFEEKMKLDFLLFNCLNSKKNALSNKLSKFDCRIVWGIDKSIYSFLSRTLLNPNYVSHLSILAPLFYKFHNKDTNALFVNFNDYKKMDIVAFAGDKLTLAKTFSVSSLLEDSYYVQKTWEELGLNTQWDKLFFTGKIADHSECIDTLKKVVTKTEKLSFKLPATVKTDAEEIPTEILNLLCEL